MGGGRVRDLAEAHEAVADLRSSMSSSADDVEIWGGEFPFERAAATVAYWNLS